MKPKFKVGDKVTYCNIPLSVISVFKMPKQKYYPSYWACTCLNNYGNATNFDEQDIEKVEEQAK